MFSLDILEGKRNSTEPGYSQTEVSMFELAVCLPQLQSPLLLWLQYVCSQAPALTNRCDHRLCVLLVGLSGPLSAWWWVQATISQQQISCLKSFAWFQSIPAVICKTQRPSFIHKDVGPRKCSMQAFHRNKEWVGPFREKTSTDHHRYDIFPSGNSH